MSGEDLQFCPAAWQHRRELLAHIDAQAAEMVVAVAESQKIQQHLVDVYNWQEQQGRPIPLTCPHGYKLTNLADGTDTCTNCEENGK